MTKMVAAAAVAIALVGQQANAQADTSRAAAAREWHAFVDRIAPVGEQIVPQMADPQDPLLRQEMYRMLVSEMSMAYFGLFLGDVDHPDFWPLLNQAFNVWGPNPDMYYYHAPIEGSGIYRISGFRGTVRIVDFQVGGGQLYNTGMGSPVGPSANYEIDSLHIRKDGYFEVLLSAERPPGYKGDWWKIFPDTTNVHVRQIAYDWLNEVDARFVIERLDRPAARPRLTAAEIQAKLDLIPGWAANMTEKALAQLRNDRTQGLVNKVALVDFAKTGGASSQKYYSGQFDLQPDEALILETTVPKCKYWSFALNDLNYSVLDYTSRQSSLNGFQARLDKDGKFRAVISATDPGVPNWLDAVGYRKGAILARWRTCDGTPAATTTKVKVSEVRKFLPADTPIVSADARDAAIRLRSKGARLRRRW